MDNDTTQDLIRALVSFSARTAFTPSELIEIVAPSKRGRDKLVAAYNRCDGTKTQAEIVKALKLHQGNFSSAVSRWIQAGVMFKIRSAGQFHLLHAYPIAQNRKGR